MIGYKFTQADLTTFNGFQWIVGEWKETSGEGELCGAGWLHAYEHPLLAKLHNPIHGNYPAGALLWRVEYDGTVKRDGQMKFGATRMRLIEQVEPPAITWTQRVAYAILCAKTVFADEVWNAWADGWLSGADRSARAIHAAYAVAYAPEYAANAAYAAVSAVDYAAKAANYAANAANYAANAACAAVLDLLALAQQAMEVTG